MKQIKLKINAPNGANNIKIFKSNYEILHINGRTPLAINPKLTDNTYIDNIDIGTYYYVYTYEFDNILYISNNINYVNVDDEDHCILRYDKNGLNISKNKNFELKHSYNTFPYNSYFMLKSDLDTGVNILNTDFTFEISFCKIISEDNIVFSYGGIKVTKTDSSKNAYKCSIFLNNNLIPNCNFILNETELTLINISRVNGILSLYINQIKIYETTNSISFNGSVFNADSLKIEYLKINDKIYNAYNIDKNIVLYIKPINSNILCKEKIICNTPNVYYLKFYAINYYTTAFTSIIDGDIRYQINVDSNTNVLIGNTSFKFNEYLLNIEIFQLDSYFKIYINGILCKTGFGLYCYGDIVFKSNVFYNIEMYDLKLLTVFNKMDQTEYIRSVYNYEFNYETDIDKIGKNKLYVDSKSIPTTINYYKGDKDIDKTTFIDSDNFISSNNIIYNFNNTLYIGDLQNTLDLNMSFILDKGTALSAPIANILGFSLSGSVLTIIVFGNKFVVTNNFNYELINLVINVTTSSIYLKYNGEEFNLKSSITFQSQYITINTSGILVSNMLLKLDNNDFIDSSKSDLMSGSSSYKSNLNLNYNYIKDINAKYSVYKSFSKSLDYNLNKYKTIDFYMSFVGTETSAYLNIGNASIIPIYDNNKSLIQYKISIGAFNKKIYASKNCEFINVCFQWNNLCTELYIDGFLVYKFPININGNLIKIDNIVGSSIRLCENVRYQFGQFNYTDFYYDVPKIEITKVNDYIEFNTGTTENWIYPIKVLYAGNVDYIYENKYKIKDEVNEYQFVIFMNGNEYKSQIINSNNITLDPFNLTFEEISL